MRERHGSENRRWSGKSIGRRTEDDKRELLWELELIARRTGCGEGRRVSEVHTQNTFAGRDLQQCCEPRRRRGLRGHRLKALRRKEKRRGREGERKENSRERRKERGREKRSGRN